MTGHRLLPFGVMLLVATASPLGAQSSCVAPRVDVGEWALARSQHLPGLTFRLPRSFRRDPAEPRWADSSLGRLRITRGGAAGASLAPLPARDDRAEYSRCEEQLGGASVVIVSYTGRTPGGEAAHAAPTGQGGPFRVHARIRWPDGMELDVLGDAADRQRFLSLLAAVRTIRRTAA